MTPVATQHRDKTVDIIIPAFGAGKGLGHSIDAALAQILPPAWVMQLVVVDDGSPEDITPSLRARYGEAIHIVRHEHNRGRSAARNTGFLFGYGVYVVFLDADCVWTDDRALGRHIAALSAGADVSVGLVGAASTGFWGEYQQAVFLRRIEAFQNGDLAALTSANCAVRRTVAGLVGGFDERFRHYGFEDRDFFLRLQVSGARFFLIEDCLVLHQDIMSLAKVSIKMYQAGRYSASIFRLAHPDYYSGTVYWKLDARAHGFMLRTLAVASRPVLPWIVTLGDVVIAGRGLPMVFKRAWVKIASGLSYLQGTCDALKAG